MRSSTGLGRAVGPDADVFAAPKSAFAVPNSVHSVIYCHGAQQSALTPTDSQYIGQYPLFNALRERYAVAAGTFSGTAWGNESSLAAVAATKEWLQGPMGGRPGKVALVGISMGTITALNYARAHPDEVACVAGIIPALDINDIYVNNRLGSAPSIDSAYGGSWNNGLYGPTHSPVMYASTLSIPVRLWYSTADSICIPSAVSAFASAYPAAVATVTSTTLDHSEAAVAAAPVADILAFIEANRDNSPIPPLYDSVATAASVTSGTTLSIPGVKPSAGATPILWVAFANGVGNSTVSAQFGSTPMTPCGAPVLCGSFAGYGYYLAAFKAPPASGVAQTVTVTTGASSFIKGNVSAYRNVATTGIPVSSGGSTGAALAVTASSAPGRRVAQCFVAFATGISGYNKQQRGYDASGAWGAGFLLGDASGASSVPFSATAGNGSYPWGAMAIDLIP